MISQSLLSKFSFAWLFLRDVSVIGFVNFSEVFSSDLVKVRRLFSCRHESSVYLIYLVILLLLLDLVTKPTRLNFVNLLYL